MLYLNEERVNLNQKISAFQKGSAEEAAYSVLQDLFKELTDGSADPKKVKWPIHFQFHPKFRLVNEESKIVEWPAARRYRCMRSISTDKKNGLNGDWLYSANAIKRDKEKNMKPNPSHFAMQKDTFVNENQLDLLFFLIFIMGDRYGDEFIIRNALMEAKKEVEYDVLETNVRQAIFTNQFLKEKDIRQIAASYGVVNVRNADMAIVRKELWKRIQGEEKKRGKTEGFNDFIQRTNMNEETQILAAINIAEGEMVIGFDKNKSKWKWMDGEGKYGPDIMLVINSNDYYPELKEFLMHNKEILDLMGEKTEEIIKRQK